MGFEPTRAKHNGLLIVGQNRVYRLAKNYTSLTPSDRPKLVSDKNLQNHFANH